MTSVTLLSSDRPLLVRYAELVYRRRYFQKEIKMSMIRNRLQKSIVRKERKLEFINNKIAMLQNKMVKEGYKIDLDEEEVIRASRSYKRWLRGNGESDDDDIITAEEELQALFEYQC